MENSRRNQTYWSTTNKKLLKLISSLCDEFIENHNKNHRALDERQQAKCLRNFEILVLDLLSVSESESDPNKSIGYSRGKKNFKRGGSYWNYNTNEPDISHTYFLKAIDFLKDKELVHNEIAAAGFNDHSSRIKPTPKLIKQFKDQGASWASIKFDVNSSTIILKDENKKNIEIPNDLQGFPLDEAKKRLIRINNNLSDTLINLNISDDDFAELKAQLSNKEIHENDDPVNLEFSNRYLKRVFSKGSLNKGGRFYGGWWQGIPSKYRRYIEIDGKMTVEMDFSTMTPAILYAQKRQPRPDDAYTLPNWDYDCFPDNQLRKIVKKAFNQLLNSDKTSRNEKQWHRFAPELELDDKPDNWEVMKVHHKNAFMTEVFKERTGRSYTDLLSELLDFHQPINEYFFSSAWEWLQNLDSQIAESIMIKLLDTDPSATALPIHDSFIVTRLNEERLKSAMVESFHEVVGEPPKVDRDEAVYDPPEGYEPKLIAADGLFAKVEENLQTHSLYHMREYEWDNR